MLKVFIINAWKKDYEIGTYCRFVSLETNIRRTVLKSTHNVSSTIKLYEQQLLTFSKYVITTNYYYH